MSDIIVLADGYSRMCSTNNHTMLADGTSTLIKSSNEIILVDTLGPWNGDKLVKLINKAGFHLEDLNYVICTHGHSDHIGNLNLFTNNTQSMLKSINHQSTDSVLSVNERTSKIKKHLVGNCVYNADSYELDPFKDQIFQINHHIQVRQTPGHTLSCISVLVDNVVNRGRVAVVGDLFEKESDLNNESIWIQAGSESIDQQKANRKFILNNYDYIVPGHGEMFKVPKVKE